MKGKRLKTTLGDLIVALTEEALLFVRNEKEANQLVADILADLLQRSAPHSQKLH